MAWHSLPDNTTGATLWSQASPTVTLTCGADELQGGLALADYTTSTQRPLSSLMLAPPLAF